MFCFYPNVLFPQEVYDKNKCKENRMEKERLKALDHFYNRQPQTGWLSNSSLLSHSSGDCKSETRCYLG